MGPPLPLPYRRRFTKLLPRVTWEDMIKATQPMCCVGGYSHTCRQGGLWATRA